MDRLDPHTAHGTTDPMVDDGQGAIPGGRPRRGVQPVELPRRGRGRRRRPGRLQGRGDRRRHRQDRRGQPRGRRQLPGRRHRPVDLRQEGDAPGRHGQPVDHDDRKVYVDRTKDQIKAAPEYDETSHSDPATGTSSAATTTTPTATFPRAPPGSRSDGRPGGQAGDRGAWRRHGRRGVHAPPAVTVSGWTPPRTAAGSRSPRCSTSATSAAIPATTAAPSAGAALPVGLAAPDRRHRPGGVQRPRHPHRHRPAPPDRGGPGRPGARPGRAVLPAHPPGARRLGGRRRTPGLQPGPLPRRPLRRPRRDRHRRAGRGGRPDRRQRQRARPGALRRRQGPHRHRLRADPVGARRRRRPDRRGLRAEHRGVRSGSAPGWRQAMPDAQSRRPPSSAPPPRRCRSSSPNSASGTARSRTTCATPASTRRPARRPPRPPAGASPHRSRTRPAGGQRMCVGPSRAGRRASPRWTATNCSRSAEVDRPGSPPPITNSPPGRAPGRPA